MIVKRNNKKYLFARPYVSFINQRSPSFVQTSSTETGAYMAIGVMLRILCLLGSTVVDGLLASDGLSMVGLLILTISDV